MTAKEGRKPTRRFEWISVGVLTTAALAVRLLGIGWGLPNSQHYFSYHPDEIFLLMPAFGFAQGDWNPHFFNYGTLYIYLVGIPAVVFHLVPDPVRFPQGLAPLYLAGRIVTALLGAATIPVLYLALRRESKGLAWGSALLLAICPLHVINSHYATVDVPATFFITLAFLFALRGAGQPTLKHAILAGLFVGLAAATKYNAALFLLPVLLAPLLATVGRVCRTPAMAGGRMPAGRRSWASWWLGVPISAALAFRLCVPWVGTPEFRKAFLFELEHARIGGTLAFVDTGSGWSYHLLHGLPVALGYPLLAAFIIGLALALRSESPALRLSLLWCLIYFAVIGFSKERFIRYLVPMMPFVCVLADLIVERSYRLAMEWKARSRWRFELLTTVVGAPFALTLFYLLVISPPLLGPDARDEAWDDNRWRAERGTVGLVSAPWYFDPPASPYNAGPFSLPLFNAWNAANGNRLIVTGWDVATLKAARPDCFVLSDLESMDPLRLKYPKAVGLVEALGRTYRNRLSYQSVTYHLSWLAPPRSWSPPDWLYPQPDITVYHSPRP
ncbi:MAG: phospholipid carrier-dependent glycosyltransferase [Armatimonadota bacterium]